MRGTDVRFAQAAAAAASLSILAITAPAVAQVEPIDPEAERLPPYGVQTGPFVMTPRLYVGALFNDNVFAQEMAAQDDVAGVVEGSASFASIWRRHALGFSVAASALGYQELESENRFNYSGEADGRIDLGQAAALFGNLSAGRFTEERGSVNLPLNAVSPVDYVRADAEAGVSYELSRTALALSVLGQTLDYDDVGIIGGGFIDNDLRDYDTVGLAIEASRETRAGHDAFVRLITDKREYTDAAATARDSQGGEVQLGVRADVTDVIDGAFYVGYMTRDYDAFRSVDGFSFGADAEWTPTAAWRIVVAGSRSIEETNDATASAFTTTNLELSALRSVLQRLSLGPVIGYRRHDFEESNREDKIVTLGVDGRFALTRMVSIDAGYRFFQRDTTLVGGEYDQNRFMLGVTLRR
jgi:hypothetical protein